MSETEQDAEAAPAVSIFYRARDDVSYAPVGHMVALACRVLGARFVPVAGLPTPPLRRLSRLLLPTPRGGGDVAIFVARGIGDVTGIACLPQTARPWRLRVLWIVDSFPTELMPRRGLFSHFDLVTYSQAYDREAYERVVGDRAFHLPWGTDALGLGGDGPDRPLDVLRVGRQPPAWDDDAATAAAAAARGLRFHGRPPMPEDPARSVPALMRDWYGQAKFVVAHSNLAAPAPYTHPTKEYITARWTDALAAGAVVAGVQPRTDMALLDWPGATLDFDRIDLGANLDALREAAGAWTPATARRNHLEALRRLDWRWRLLALADRIGLRSPSLLAETARLRARIDALSRTPAG